MSRRLILDVPAKINLFLHVTGRRADGYHLLESIFCPINCHDRLELALNRQPGVSLTGGMPGLAAEEDLAVRAARALLVKTSATCGVQITLEKFIPAGAGMGGGSADAAFTLMGLNELLGNPLAHADLHQLALSLGADVPFFLTGEPSFVTGIGDVLEPVDVPELALAIVKPPAHIATPAIFSHPDLTRDCTAVKMSVFGFSDAAQRLAYVRQHTSNVLQHIAINLAPGVGQALSLYRNAPAYCAPSWYRMTGSGSAVFGVFESIIEARNFAAWANDQIHRLPVESAGGTAGGRWFVWHGKTVCQAHLGNQIVHTT